ncbi:hypothetical protein D3H64_06235 [Atopobacter sp. AH10]|uniref:hypothetical protein n=1 Tax=Atopobacter sp. AH10 TaxID=2315861 RepID=UPI000EF25930|nr:hypothetical protein [Atopobacter sp. AH10]RLK63103.1 hypothetical protein D3H64_06235 [Atopobacter sp. AH10]
MGKINFEGKVDLERLEKISGASGDAQARTTPTVVAPLTTPELTAISALTVGISNFVTKFKSCGKGFC